MRDKYLGVEGVPRIHNLQVVVFFDFVDVAIFKFGERITVRITLPVSEIFLSGNRLRWELGRQKMRRRLIS